jgi:predicted nuclease of predicted toxin-antitoxin system
VARADPVAEWALRFLVDECLTPALVGAAHAAGHEAHHVAHIGLASAKDWSVAGWAVRHDQIFVTNNATDFRVLYARLAVHPGLLIIVPSVDRETQVRLFGAVLAKLSEIGEPVSRIIEARLDGGDIRLALYAWPSE